MILHTVLKAGSTNADISKLMTEIMNFQTDHQKRLDQVIPSNQTYQIRHIILSEKSNKIVVM